MISRLDPEVTAGKATCKNKSDCCTGKNTSDSSTVNPFETFPHLSRLKGRHKRHDNQEGLLSLHAEESTWHQRRCKKLSYRSQTSLGSRLVISLDRPFFPLDHYNRGFTLYARVETWISRANISSMVGQIVMNCFIVAAADLSSPD